MAINSPLKYASYTMVQARLNGKTPLTQQQIENIIEQSEQYVDTLMKNNGVISFDVNKHQIIRDAVINRAAMLVANAEPLSLQTFEQASMMIDVLRDAFMQDVEKLSDQDFILFLKGL